MYKFLYFGKWYCSGLSLDEITRQYDNGGDLFAYAVRDDGSVSMIPTIISADKIANIQVMK